MNDGPTQDGETSWLSPGDEFALEWLLDHGLDPSGAPPDLASRVSRVANVLALAGTADVPYDAARRDSVLKRLGNTAETEPDHAEFELSEADQDALDALVMAGMDASRVPSALRDRAERASSLSDLLSMHEQSYDVGLTDRTLAAVGAAAPHTGSDRFTAGRIGGRLADLISVAAVVLIAASVVWPVLSTLRQNAVKQTNQANLAVAGLGLGAYAADFADSLPRVQQPRQMERWWEVTPDAPQSNASNLFALARLEYVPQESLKSPGNEHAPVGPLPEDALDWQSIQQVSYSYLLPVQGKTSASAMGVVVADRSPVVLRVLAGQEVDITENSPNHDGRGQHMLRGDGSVFWNDTPRTQYGDHIYLLKSTERALNIRRGQFVPPIWDRPEQRHHADVFLGP
ncbi:MAG: hypothetical protein AAFN41_05005 [Planctomycetota bacterium]